ncbi:MAG TPA: sugar ABC transporter permease, partial [Spirochaetia bacterium]|nr:sugar ABC transporter permease [Spirochaetia bacterium]
YLLLWGLCVADAWSNRRAFLETGKSQNLLDFVKDLWNKAYVWILIAPIGLLIAFFTFIPFVYTFLCSFTDWTYKVYLLQQLVHWKGMSEYVTVFAEPAWFQIFIQVFGWTVLWALLSSVTVYVMGFAHALVVESPLVKGKKFWRTVIIIPWALPAMISLLTFRNVFDKDGLMNQLLLQTGLMKPFSNVLFALGLEGKPDDIIFWFAPPYNANLAKAVAVMVNLWLGAPYFMMLIVGIIATIPADRYEAAMIDGANGFQKFRYITLPMVLNATIPAMVMTVTFNFNNFGAMYFLTGGGPTWLLEKLPDSLRTWTNSMPGQTDILISWIYKISFNANSQLYNKAAVYTVFIFLILGIFSVVNMRMTKAFDDLGEE